MRLGQFVRLGWIAGIESAGTWPLDDHFAESERGFIGTVEDFDSKTDRPICFRRPLIAIADIEQADLRWKRSSFATLQRRTPTNSNGEIVPREFAHHCQPLVGQPARNAFS